MYLLADVLTCFGLLSVQLTCKSVSIASALFLPVWKRQKVSQSQLPNILSVCGVGN